MSRTIDEKVVEMRFDNRDFERNVSQSMSTLDKLKSALNFDGAANAFSGISAAANKLDFSSLGGAIEGVGEKFSALETIAVGALLNIGNKVSDLAMKTVKELTLDQVTAGFEKYADKTKSVQTIIAATGKEIGEVSDQLDRLMWYTDETSYSFQDMVSNISKFTSNGIELDQAVTAMEGISNWAAISGQGKNEAGRVMYNLSQALSMGSVKLQDWKSIELANMATEEFRKMAIEAGVAKKALAEFEDEQTGEKFYATYHLADPMDEFSEKIADVEVDYLNFRETLKEEWFNKDVLIEVLNYYGEFADKLSQTYDDINSKEGIDVTTSQLIKMTEQFKAGTLDMDQAMAITGKTADELSEILTELGKDEYNLGRKAFAAAQEARTFQDAIDATKDAVSTQFMRTFELLFGNYEEAKVLWTDLANELWEIFAGPISDMNDMLSAWKNLKIGGREDFIEGIKNIYRAVRSVTDPISEAWETIFPPMTFKQLGDLIARFKNFTDSLILTEDKMEFLSERFEMIFGAVRKVAVGFKSLIDIGADFVKTFSVGLFGGTKGFLTGFSNVAEQIGKYVENVTYAVARIKSAREDYENGALEAYSYIQENEKRYGLLLKIADVLDKMKESVGVLGALAGRFVNIDDYLLNFGEAGGGIAGIINVIYTRIADVVRAAEDLVHIWTGEDISKWVDPIMKGFREFEKEIERIQSDGWFDKIKEDLAGVAKAFSETFGPGFKETFKYVFDALKYIAEDWIGSFSGLIGEGSISLEGFFRTIDDGLLSIQNFIRTNETLASVMGGIKEAIKMIADFAKNFLSIRQVIDTYQAAGGGISGVLAVINDKLGQIFKLIGDLVKRYTGLDLTSVGKGIMLVIGTIEEAVIRLADKIATLLGWKNNPFHEFLESSESTFGKLQALIGKFTNVDVGGIGALGEKLKGVFAPLGGIFAGFGKVLGGVWAVVQATIPLIGEALSWFGDLLVNLAEKIKGMTFGDILSIIKIILTIKKIATWQKLFGGVSDTLDKLGDVLKTWQTKLRAEAMMAIGAAILMVAGALFAISLIPTDQLIKSLIALVVALGALTVSIRVITEGLSKLFSTSTGANIKAITSFMGVLLAFGKAMVDTAVAMGIMVVAIKMLAKTEGAWTAIKQLGTVLGGIVASLFVLGRFVQSGKIKETAKGILEISAALGVLAIALKLMNNVKWGSIGKMAAAFRTLAGITVAIGLIDRLLSQIDSFEDIGKGLLYISGALAVLTGVLFAMQKMPFLDLIASILKLNVAVLGFGVAAAAMSLFIKPVKKLMEALGEFSKVLKNVAITLGILSLIGIVLGDAAPAVAEAAVNLITSALGAVAERAPEIVDYLLQIILSIIQGLADHSVEIVGAVVQLVGGIIKGAREALGEGDVSLADFAIGTGLVAGLIALVVMLKKGTKKGDKVSIQDFSYAGKMLIEASALLLELGVLFTAMGWLAGATGAAGEIEKFGTFAELIASALMGNNGGVLLLFTSLMLFEGLVTKYIEKLGTTKDNLKAFGTIALMIGEVMVLLEELGLLFSGSGWLSDAMSLPEQMAKFSEFSDAIVKALIGDGEHSGVWALLLVFVALEGILGKFLGGGGGLSLAGGSLEVFVALAAILAEAVVLIDELGALFAATGLAIEAIESASGSDVIGFINTCGEFFEATSIAIGKFFGGFVNGAVKGATEGVTEEMVNILKGIGEVLLVMSAAEFISGISMFTGGPIGLAVLGSELAGLAPGFKDFAEGVKDLPDNVVDKALKSSEALGYLLDLVPKQGGLLQVLTGTQDIEKFGNGLATLGKGLKKFSTNIAGIDSNVVENAKTAVATIIEMATDDNLPINTGLPAFIHGTTDLEEFGKGLGHLATGLKTYSENIEGLKSDVVANTKTAVATIIELASGVPESTTTSWFWGLFKKEGESGLKDFGANLEAFGGSLVAYSNTIDGVKPVLITNTSSSIKGVVEIAQNVSKLTEDQRTNITGSGKAIATLGENFKKYYDNVKDVDTQKVHLVNVQLKELVDAFSGMTEDFSKNVTTFGTSIVSTLAKAIKSEVSVGIIYDAVDNLLGSMNIHMNSFINGSVKGKNGTSVYGERIIRRLIIGLNNEEKRKLLSDAVAGVIDSIGVVLSDKSEGFSENGAKLLEALGAGLGDTDAIELIKQMFVDFFEGILNDIYAKYEEFKMAGSNAVNNVVDGLKSVDVEAQAKDVGANVDKGVAKGVEENAHIVIEAVQKVGGQMIAAQMKTLEERSPSKVAERIGRYFNEGLEYGILDSIEGPVDAARDVASGAENVVRDVLGIHSKSRLMDLIGKFFDEGFASGIIENIPMVKTAVVSLLDAVKSGAGGDQIISMIQSFGLSIPDTMASAIQEASSDPIEYGDLFGDSLFSGDLSSLSSVLGMDQMQNYLTGEFQSVFSGAGSSGLEGVSDYLNAETGEGITQEFVVDGMCGNLNTYKDYAYESYSEVAESGVDGVLDVFADKADQLGDMTIQGPTVTLVADTSQVDDALDEYAYFHGEKFDKHGELDAFLLAFDNMDDNAKLNAATQFAEHGNEDMADYLTRRRKGLLTEGDLSDLRAARSANEAWQQAATEFSQTTKESNDLLMARLAETNENLLKIHEEIMAFRGDVSEFDNMQVVLDTGTLVGEMTPMIDEQLNNRSMTGGRMVHR